MREEEVRALFLLAGIEVTAVYKIENRYWPEAYVEMRQKSPWWLVKTSAGLVRIGWRKRVIEIEWTDTPVRVIVTTDDVTKTDDLVHAWSHGQALIYLSSLGTEFRRAALNPTPSTGGAHA